MIRFCKQVLFFILLSPVVAMAAVPSWQIVTGKSAINFTATQNDAPVTGQFKNFTGEINFDPAQLDASNIRIVVDLNSVNTSYSEVAETLKTADWFNVKVFPQAIFTANKFVKAGDNSYQAEGSLTIRDKTVPVILTFTLDEYTKTQASAHGAVTLKRTAFGVGQGEWAKTDGVKDGVQVKFTLQASAKS